MPCQQILHMLYLIKPFYVAYAISGGAIMIFSEFVISVRKKLNLSQKQLASAINVSYSTINRWENGHVVPSNLAVKVFMIFARITLF